MTSDFECYRGENGQIIDHDWKKWQAYDNYNADLNCWHWQMRECKSCGWVMSKKISEVNSV